MTYTFGEVDGESGAMGAAEDEAAIRDVILAMAEAFNDHDAARLSEMYTPNADLMTVAGEWLRERTGIEAGMQAVFKTRAANAHMEPIEMSIRPLAPDIAIAHVQNRLSGLVDASGQLLPSQVEFSLRVFVKRGGAWLVEAMHNRRLDPSRTA